MKALKRLLFEVHRWLGIVLALFMFFWFVTGLAIMYTTPAAQSRSQRLAHAETLAPEAGWLSLGEAWDRSAGQRKAAKAHGPRAVGNAPAETSADRLPAGEPGIADARLARSGGEPLWLIEDNHGRYFALSAIDGSLHDISVGQALKIAQNWTGGASDVMHLETVEKTVKIRNQDALSPFHHIAIDNDAGEELYISARTGEVLHASTRVDRAFYWAGNWLHLLKPLDSIGLGHIRHDVQLWLGLSATIATLTGLIIGWLRWRPGFGGKPTYSQGRTQPYREFWFKWHFWSGLIGGTVVLFWAISGFIDTNPGQWFSPANPSREELVRYSGGKVPAAMRDWRPVPIDGGSDIVELGWRSLGDEAVLLSYTRDGQRQPQSATNTVPQFSQASLVAGVQRLAGDTQLERLSILTDYDSYYYPRHHQGLTEKPLPVLLVTLADDAGTRLYLDPQDGRLLAKLDRSRRVFRWLYSGLHHWDFGWLYHRPIWDAWMLTWVAFGSVLGASSLVVGWRRLRQTFRIKKKTGRKVQVASEAAG
jgi:hypothetical protein